MKCQNCGNQIPDDSVFCPDCGIKIIVSNVETKVPHILSEPINRGGKQIVTDSEILNFTVCGVSFDMIKVDHGSFLMGATEEQMYPYEWEKPVREVTISKNYYIGKFPVTQALWNAIIKNNPSCNQPEQKWENYPTEWVSWNDCIKFIEQINKLLQKRINNKKFRLPTEAEWEFAARGGKKSCGFQYAGSNTLNDVAWNETNSSDETHPVGYKKPNELGIYDMCGNISEWCQDNWLIGYDYKKCKDPKGPHNGLYKVIRGGSCFSKVNDCRVASRENRVPGDRYCDVGFRLCLSDL